MLCKEKKNSINLVLQNIKMIVKSCPTIPLTSHPFIIIDVNGIPLDLALEQGCKSWHLTLFSCVNECAHILILINFQNY